MASSSRSKKSKHSRAQLPTQWSDFSWETEGGYWFRYRVDAHGADEYEYDYPYRAPTTSPDEPAQPQPGLTRQMDTSSYELPTATFSLEYSQSKPNPPNRSASEPTFRQTNPWLNVAFFDYWGNEKVKVALMDTGGGDESHDIAIASRVVGDLGWSDKVNRQAPLKKREAANGGVMLSEGTIKLTWKVANGWQTHENVFFVFPFPRLDVIFGNGFLIEKKVFDSFNIGPLMPFEPQTTESPYDKEQRQQQEDIQKKGATASEERIKRSGEKKAKKKSTSHTNR